MPGAEVRGVRRPASLWRIPGFHAHQKLAVTVLLDTSASMRASHAARRGHAARPGSQKFGASLRLITSRTPQSSSCPQQADKVNIPEGVDRRKACLRISKVRCNWP